MVGTEIYPEWTGYVGYVKTGLVETEVHFLLECSSIYEDLRQQLFCEIALADPSFLYLSQEQAFMYLMSSSEFFHTLIRSRLHPVHCSYTTFCWFRDCILLTIIVSGTQISFLFLSPFLYGANWTKLISVPSSQVHSTIRDNYRQVIVSSTEVNA